MSRAPKWMTAALLLTGFGSRLLAADAMPEESPRASLMASPITATDGRVLYESVCQGCHMPSGAGAAAAGYYPALAKDARLANKSYPLLRVLNGSKGMPAFATAMSDEQIAAVVGYVRTHFGNAYHEQVKGTDVKALRKK